MDPGPWVLRVDSKEYLIEFSSFPPTGGGRKNTLIPTDSGPRNALENELHALLAKGAILEATSSFLMPTIDRYWRPILNLKPLNKCFVRPTMFQIETLAIAFQTHKDS